MDLFLAWHVHILGSGQKIQQYQNGIDASIFTSGLRPNKYFQLTDPTAGEGSYFEAMTTQQPFRLATEVTAPVFSLTDIYDRVIDLNNFRDKRVLIAFFRHAGCPFCNLRVHSLTKVHEELKGKGFEMIFFFESKQSVILRSSFHQGVSPIPIISDPEKIWYTKYGLETSLSKSVASHLTSFVQTSLKAMKEGVPIHMMASGESFSTMPAEFLLDRELAIKKLHYSPRLNDRMDIEEIRRFAATGKAD